METGKISSDQITASQPIEVKKREWLSDEELGNLISAIGNHEAKAITLGLMKPKTVYSSRGLHRAVLQSQGNKTGWKVNGRTPFQYCRDSLAPIGLVAQEVLNTDTSTYGYIKTEYGATTGDALTGLLLDFSLRYPDYSLIDLLGDTASPSKTQDSEGTSFKKRGTTARIKLFWEILTSDLPIRVADLTEGTKVDNASVGKHLFNLSENGVISYESVKLDEPRAFYSVSGTAPPNKPEPASRLITFTEFVWQLMKSAPDKKWTIEKMTEEYKKGLEGTGSTIKDSSVKNAIARVMSHLIRTGYLKTEKFNSKKQSEVSINHAQRIMILDLISLIDSFQTQEATILEQGIRLKSKILSDPEKVSKLMAKAKEHSFYAQSNPIEETTRQILYIISSHPNCTSETIYEELSKERRRLSKASIRNMLRLLASNSAVQKTVVKGAGHFMIAER